MQGSGNDFVVIDNRKNQYSLEEVVEYTPRLCNRKYGVGADGLMALNPPEQPGLDYTMIYRNADGSDAGMCGNGSRCLALYASQLGLGASLTFNVHEHIYSARVHDQQQISVAFPVEVTVAELQDDDGSTLYQAYTGTEHIVRMVTGSLLKDEKQLAIEGRRLRKHAMFQPGGTNVNFMYGGKGQQPFIHTYERGVEDLTLACGTGAIASALVWHHRQGSVEIDNRVEIHTSGGALQVYFTYTPETASYTDIKLEGPAHFVFEGTFYV